PGPSGFPKFFVCLFVLPVLSALFEEPESSHGAEPLPFQDHSHSQHAPNRPLLAPALSVYPAGHATTLFRVPTSFAVPWNVRSRWPVLPANQPTFGDFFHLLHSAKLLLRFPTSSFVS